MKLHSLCYSPISILKMIQMSRCAIPRIVNSKSCHSLMDVILLNRMLLNMGLLHFWSRRRLWLFHLLIIFDWWFFHHLLMLLLEKYTLQNTVILSSVLFSFNGVAYLDRYSSRYTLKYTPNFVFLIEPCFKKIRFVVFIIVRTRTLPTLRCLKYWDIWKFLLWNNYCSWKYKYLTNKHIIS